MHAYLVSPGDCLVFGKEVVDDNFGKSRVVHLLLLFVTSVVNLSGDDNTQSDKEKGSDSEQETDENETGSEYDQQENEEVKDDEEDEFLKTPSNYTPIDEEDETNVESKVADNAKGNENLEITLDQVIEDAHVTISTVAKKTEVPFTSSSHSSDLASKFLNFVDIPHADVEIVSPMSWLKKRRHAKDDEPTKRSQKLKNSKSGSSKGTNYQSNSSGMSVQTEELEFEIADSDMPQNQVGNLGNDDEELTREVVSKHDWFTNYNTHNPDWIVGKTPYKGQIPKLVDASDELYKCSDGHYTRLVLLLMTITKNIQMVGICKEDGVPLEMKSSYHGTRLLTRQPKERWD
ncbi:hypothetical protein Tco_1474515 [Tanacetum coccineum]